LLLFAFGKAPTHARGEALRLNPKGRRREPSAHVAVEGQYHQSAAAAVAAAAVAAVAVAATVIVASTAAAAKAVALTKAVCG